MEDITEFFRNFFMAENWPARWSCGRWTGFHGWMYIVSDIAIWSAYFAIPIIILVVIQKRKEELPFIKILWLFILFILACGTTHLIDAIMFWYPAYRLSSFFLLGTAIISWITVYFLVKILPQALSLKSPAQLETIISERTFALEESINHQRVLNRDLDHFVYSASHDLKSPINNIEGLMTLLKEEIIQYDNKECIDVINRIDNSLSRVKKTINNLTDVLKVQRNPYEDRAQLNFEELLKEIVFENEELIRKANAIIETDFEIENIYYSQTGLKSILYNLVSNAVKYKSEKRRPLIKIKTFKRGADVVLTVEDNGLGMDIVKHREKVFGIFKRLNDTVEGSGIGLYIIKRLIEENGGTIDASSEVDKGSIFTIIIPPVKQHNHEKI
jgi:chemotaxis family two-component system sensor kinase Cph1